MAEPRLCPACRAWRCSADDAWCGRCGEPCAQIGLSVEPAVLQAGQLAPKIFLRVTNASCAALPVHAVELPAWLALAQPMPGPLRAGQTVLVAGSARTLGMKSAEAAGISVVTPAGRGTALLMVIEEHPALVCDPPELEVWDTRGAAGGTPQNMALTISPRAGFLRVREIRPGPAGGLTVVSDLGEGMLASPGAGARVVVAASADRVRHLTSTTLLVRFDGPHGVASVEAPVRLVVRNPPQIRWVGEHHPPEERLQAAGQTMQFVLMNQAPDGRDGGTGNAALTLEGATLTPPMECADTAVRLLTRLPARVRGGEAFTLEFAMDLGSVRSRPRIPLHFTLIVQTNGPALEKAVPLFVRPMPEFDGVLAIDFGSSNTCCAVVETGRDYERLPLDGESIVSPTVVRYLDLSGPTPETETGARVKNLAAKSEEVAASTVDKLKQRLGNVRQDIPVRPRGAALWTTRTATEAAADYLRQLRRVAEAGKGAVFREFILTHPAVCSLRQYRNLSAALKQAFGEQAGQIHFLQEPIAALIPFLAEMAGRPGQGDYTVASFDLGGGTTDLALVRVEHVRSATGRVEIHPAILHCRGVRFGGEDLTDYLEARLTANFMRLLEAQKPGARLASKSLAGASMEDILRNRFAFREAAEQFKSSLGEQGAMREPGQVIVRVQPAPGEAAQDFNAGFAELRQAGGTDLKEDFVRYAAAQVSEIALLLRTIVEQRGALDVIQLSGMTSFLPLVGEVLRSVFPGVRVERAGDPKQCVVTGACLSRTLSRGAQRRLVLPPGGTQRTTSSIGMYDAESASFTPILPMDTAIPIEGLEGDLAAAWYGAERVPLFENLGAGAEELRTPAGQTLLSKLGTWKPERLVVEAENEPWALRVRLKDFALAVSATGPAGESVAFRLLEDGGTW